MSISVGGIDIAGSIINLEYELARTQRILEWLLANNPSLRAPPQNVLARIDDDAFLHLQKRFPEAGIQRTRGGAA